MGNASGVFPSKGQRGRRSHVRHNSPSSASGQLSGSTPGVPQRFADFDGLDPSSLSRDVADRYKEIRTIHQGKQQKYMIAWSLFSDPRAGYVTKIAAARMCWCEAIAMAVEGGQKTKEEKQRSGRTFLEQNLRPFVRKWLDLAILVKVQQQNPDIMPTLHANDQAMVSEQCSNANTQLILNHLLHDMLPLFLKPEGKYDGKDVASFEQLQAYMESLSYTEGLASVLFRGGKYMDLATMLRQLSWETDAVH